MLDCLPATWRGLQTQPEQWGSVGQRGLECKCGEEGVELEAGRRVCGRSEKQGEAALPFCLQPELQGGGWGPAEGRCQQLQLERPPSPSTRAPGQTVTFPRISQVHRP